MEVKGVGRRRTHLLDDLRNRRYWELKEKQKIEKDGNGSSSTELKEEIQIIFHNVKILFYH
jgi:hypothetical protein